MIISEWAGIVTGLFKFWDQVVWLIKKLQKTPEEDRQKIILTIGNEIAEFKKTGRPSWK